MGSGKCGILGGDYVISLPDTSKERRCHFLLFGYMYLVPR